MAYTNNLSGMSLDQDIRLSRPLRHHCDYQYIIVLYSENDESRTTWCFMDIERRNEVLVCLSGDIQDWDALRSSYMPLSA